MPKSVDVKYFVSTGSSKKDIILGINGDKPYIALPFNNFNNIFLKIQDV